jgi:hypothetical protein
MLVSGELTPYSHSSRAILTMALLPRTWLKKKATNHAVSTNGFEVLFHGRDNLLYIERLPRGDRRKVTVYAGLQIGGKKATLAGGFCDSRMFQSVGAAAG